jgi:uncharacterized protein (UPF0147 family)
MTAIFCRGYANQSNNLLHAKANNGEHFTDPCMSTRKKEEKERVNLEKLTTTISTLDAIVKNRDIQRNTRNLVKDVLAILKDEKSGTITVRAANAVSMLDGLTQSRQMESHIRTMLWQVVSTLENIRE